MDEGFEFHWYPGQPPYFIAPNGKKHRCKIRGRVPVLGGEGSSALAAADGDSIRITGNPASAGKASGFQYVATRTGWPMQRKKPRRTPAGLAAETRTGALSKFDATNSGVKGAVSQKWMDLV